MTTMTLRKKIVARVNKADDRLLKLVNALMNEYEETESDESLMSDLQKKELDKRLNLHKQGKLQYYSLSQIKKSLGTSKKGK